MLGKQENHTDQPQLVTVEALVPKNHILRRLHAALDLAFVREKVAPLYSRFGRPSLDPEVMIVGRCDLGFKEASRVRVAVDGRYLESVRGPRNLALLRPPRAHHAFRW